MRGPSLVSSSWFLAKFIAELALYVPKKVRVVLISKFGKQKLPSFKTVHFFTSIWFSLGGGVGSVWFRIYRVRNWKYVNNPNQAIMVRKCQQKMFSSSGLFSVQRTGRRASTGHVASAVREAIVWLFSKSAFFFKHCSNGLWPLTFP